MTDRERFHHAAGLDAEFPDAERRWAKPTVPPVINGIVAKSLQDLRDRFQKEMTDAQSGTDKEFVDAQERFEIVSSTYQPPSDADLQMTRQTVKGVLNATNSALRQLEAREQHKVQWYQEDLDMAVGVEDQSMLLRGPGMSIKGRHDPMVPLLLVRDLIKRYLDNLDAERPSHVIGTKARKRAVLERIAGVLFAAKVETKDVNAVLESKGIAITDHALDQLASRQRESGEQPPVRGGAPRKPRKPRKTSKRRQRKAKP